MAVGRNQSPKTEEPVFTVDTHLFRELGNYLVGRDSTALIELVKNSYDADATAVVVRGTNLHDPETGVIIVSDNGTGMTEAQFRQGFLRIASRAKEEGDRRSPFFHRRYTGAKGIGRLAAHKLAETLTVRSVSGSPKSKSATAIEASIDWRAIEAQTTLDQIRDEVVVRALVLGRPETTGTRIELSRLRKGWEPEERGHFVQECNSLQAPRALLSPLNPQILPKAMLFEAPIQRLTSSKDKGFELRLEGDFSTGESLWEQIVSSADWVIEIDLPKPKDGDSVVVRYGIAPTALRAGRQSGLKPRVIERSLPAMEDRPYFQARILVQVNPKDKINERQRVRQQSGVRVYVEGFRVLPYGDIGNDWLSLDANYSRRSTLDYAKEIEQLFKATVKDSNWSNLFLPNRSVFGAVFITQDNSGGLIPLVNREGFLPNPAYDELRENVRIGLDLFTRIRADSEYEERSRARANREKPNRSPGSTVLDTIAQASGVVRSIQNAVATSDTATAKRGITDLTSKMETLEGELGEIVTQSDLLRITASVGTQMGEFVHEVQTLLGTAQTVCEALDRIRKDPSLSKNVRAELAAVHAAALDMRRQLERQASYLIDISTPDASRRRSKLKLADRFDAALRLVSRAAENRGIDIRNEIPLDLKSPAMFPAELTTVFSNLLTNAVKNAGQDGVILATGGSSEGRVFIKVQNTGNAVDLQISERLFRPYVSTTTMIDPTLGQGMGLGLPITRSTLERYGIQIEFVAPDKGLATAVLIKFPS
jgi:signal transduction histidine kinase